MFWGMVNGKWSAFIERIFNLVWDLQKALWCVSYCPFTQTLFRLYRAHHPVPAQSWIGKGLSWWFTLQVSCSRLSCKYDKPLNMTGVDTRSPQQCVIFLNNQRKHHIYEVTVKWDIWSDWGRIQSGQIRGDRRFVISSDGGNSLLSNVT